METEDTEELDRINKEEILRERADLMQVPILETTNLGKHIEGLFFMLSGEKYAIDSTSVSEVIQISEITPLPCTPAFLRGIINLRGKILSIIDIKSFLNLKGDRDVKLNKVIIVNHNDIEIGILTDEIVGNEKIYLDTLQKNLSTIIDIPENIVVGVSEENLIVIDIQKLLSNEKIIVNEHV